jgi:hypothetical protein
MSREERRAYQRQMKGMERGPAVPPAARARAERKAARRARRGGGTARPGEFTSRFWIRSVLIAAAIGFVAFSLQWSNGMPMALYIGLAAAALVLLILVGFRFLQRRAATR